MDGRGCPRPELHGAALTIGAPFEHGAKGHRRAGDHGHSADAAKPAIRGYRDSAGGRSFGVITYAAEGTLDGSVEHPIPLEQLASERARRFQGAGLEVVARGIRRSGEQSRPPPPSCAATAGRSLRSSALPALRLVALCAGDARDVVPVLAARADRDQVDAVLVELDEELASRAASASDSARLVRVVVRHADAGDPAAFRDVLPVHVLMLCGVFGNVHHATVADIARASPAMSIQAATSSGRAVVATLLIVVLRSGACSLRRGGRAGALWGGSASGHRSPWHHASGSSLHLPERRFVPPSGRR